MTSGEWRDGEHYYLPDEFRISLFTKNSAGELVPVSGFQDRPEHGWQAIHEDGRTRLPGDLGRLSLLIPSKDTSRRWRICFFFSTTRTFFLHGQQIPTRL